MKRNMRFGHRVQICLKPWNKLHIPQNTNSYALVLIIQELYEFLCGRKVERTACRYVSFVVVPTMCNLNKIKMWYPDVRRLEKTNCQFSETTWMLGGD